MKKTEGYRIRKLEDEYVVLPFGKRAEEVNEVISLSETAGFMYLHAEEADSAEELAELVSKAYEVEKSVVYEDVVSVVRTLREKGLLLCSYTSQKSSQSETKRTYWQHQKPESREKAVYRIPHRDFSAIAYKSNEFAPELVRAKRTLNLILIISSHIIAIGSNTDDTVQNKNSLIAAVESHIISLK